MAAYSNRAANINISASPNHTRAQRNRRSDSPYQQRTTERDNPTQVFVKQAVDYLIQQLEAGKSETLTAYLAAMARFHSYSFGNILQIARQRPTATRVGVEQYSRYREGGNYIVVPDLYEEHSKFAQVWDKNLHAQGFLEAFTDKSIRG